MREHAERLNGLGTTIFAEMSALAVATNSVNLGQGFPDQDGPDSLLEDAITAIRAGANQYPPARGVPALRQAIADHQKRFYDLSYDPDTQVLVTTGATEAIAAALLAYVEPGDEVIALEPYYDSYSAGIAFAGGRRVPVTLRAPDYRLDLDELRAAVTPRTKVLLINSPHNPTGTVLTDDELRGITAVAVEHDLIVITDEVYEHLVYDGRQHKPLASYDGMAERTVSISSAGKTFSVTGWKIGWVTGTPAMVTAVTTAKQFLTFTSGAPFQPAVAGALALGNDYFDALRADLQARRDLLCDGLEDLGFGVHRPQGTYFVTTDIRPLGHTDGIDFCRLLPERTGVVAIPHQVFYDNPEAGRPLVRWAFCKQPPILQEALTRLQKL
ncbi:MULTISPECIES: pyridoxal phosphate-dependent aminotransferase [unclassified Kribbella]|uniref:pyridoxal phosphate-dependent aminotransferase n=1 Tax=unclassified Kribbella TaxID=2644121 RepID=UPI003077D3EF